MKIRQLFRKKDDRLLQTILSCFDIENLNSKVFISEYEMHRKGVIEKINNVKPILEEYYIPCKYRHNVDKEHNIRSCINILRQIIRLYDYKVVRIIKNIGNDKHIYFKIENINDNSSVKLNTVPNILIEFE